MSFGLCSTLSCRAAGARRRGRSFGFTLLEIAVVLAIVSLLVGLTLMTLGDIKGSITRTNLASNLLGTLSSARARALARQRTQVVVIDAILAANNTYGFYQFEDAAASPNILASSDLSTILGTLDPSNPSSAPAPYVLKTIDWSSDVKNQYLTTTNAWGGALPFPWALVPTNTTAGCSFCAAGTGAIGFLPNGRAIFSDGNAVGGLVMLQNTNTAGIINKTGVAVSPTGFFQKLVP